MFICEYTWGHFMRYSTHLQHTLHHTLTTPPTTTYTYNTHLHHTLHHTLTTHTYTTHLQHPLQQHTLTTHTYSTPYTIHLQHTLTTHTYNTHLQHPLQHTLTTHPSTEQTFDSINHFFSFLLTFDGRVSRRDLRPHRLRDNGLIRVKLQT